MSLEVAANTFDERSFHQSLARALPGIATGDIQLTVTNHGEVRRRSLQSGTASVDVTIVSGSAYVANRALAELSGMIESGAAGDTLHLEGADSLLVVSRPAVDLAYAFSPPPPPLPPDLPLEDWASIYGGSVGLGGALQASGNDTVIFVENGFVRGQSARHGGALAVLDGATAYMHNVRLVENEARTGGAAYVRGGRLIADNCSMHRNVATREGGGIHVESGTVVLRDRSIISGNEAVEGVDVEVDQGVVYYTLPAPFGHWIDSPTLLEMNDTTLYGRLGYPLRAGSYDSGVPYACAAGHHGLSYLPKHQSTPSCQGLCVHAAIDRPPIRAPYPCPAH